VKDNMYQGLLLCLSNWHWAKIPDIILYKEGYLMRRIDVTSQAIYR
jgi:hypothetical protein